MWRLVEHPARTCRFVLAGVAVAAVWFLAPTIGLAEEAAPPARAGQWIHVDPKTGAPGPAAMPSAVRAAIAADPAHSTSQQGLIEEPAPGGGVMVDLQGRFRSAMIATPGPDGKVVVECLPPGTTAGAE